MMFFVFCFLFFVFHFSFFLCFFRLGLTFPLLLLLLSNFLGIFKIIYDVENNIITALVFLFFVLFISFHFLFQDFV